jgi:hypothetical protein
LIALTARVEALELQARKRQPDDAVVSASENDTAHSWEFSI